MFGKKVIEFCKEHGYERELSVNKLFPCPMISDFVSIFKFLVSSIDPNFSAVTPVESNTSNQKKAVDAKRKSNNKNATS